MAQIDTIENRLNFTDPDNTFDLAIHGINL